MHSAVVGVRGANEGGEEGIEGGKSRYLIDEDQLMKFGREG